MIIALDLSAVKEFISIFDTGQEKTVFKIGVIDSITRAKIEDNQTEFLLNRAAAGAHADMRINRRQRNFEIVRYGLRGWENVKDSKGTNVLFETSMDSMQGSAQRPTVSDTCLRLIPGDVIDELAAEIVRENTLSKEEEKNS